MKLVFLGDVILWTTPTPLWSLLYTTTNIVYDYQSPTLKLKWVMKSLTIGFRVQLNKSFTQEATQPEIGYTVRNMQVCNKPTNRGSLYNTCAFFRNSLHTMQSKSGFYRSGDIISYDALTLYCPIVLVVVLSIKFLSWIGWSLHEVSGK